MSGAPFFSKCYGYGLLAKNISLIITYLCNNPVDCFFWKVRLHLQM